MKKRDPQSHESHERWLVSYADFITLLFAFFVVLYASSQVDKRKVGQLATAIQHAFQQMGAFPGKVASPTGGAASQASYNAAAERFALLVNSKEEQPAMGRADLSGLKHELELALAPEIRRNEVAMQLSTEGLIISLREIGFFKSGSATMRSDSQVAFGRIASLLLQFDCSVRVEGHTDNVPIHTAQFASNWELSTARATEVIRRFIVEYGFAPMRLSAAGFGEYHPVAINDTEDGRRLNRRIDLVVLPPKGRSVRIGPQASSIPQSDKVDQSLGR